MDGEVISIKGQGGDTSVLVLTVDWESQDLRK